MGFLSAKQEGQKEPRIKQWMLGFPDKGSLSYIWEWICEIGLGTAITWAEIKAWSDITGVKPTKDEAFALVQLSNAWLNERSRGQGKHETPNWAGE